ncbi:patatin-like phospholipase family protein [Vogesella sp. LIG4]|uniref:patatin-like phospholipase family protein n=1 Tax=Vogesella sp. LIG4 TaxID=1192162 RepID=UPI00081FE20B|nr:patatin-like phospholipase family protein [Vogesella sp. LIG4]SCK30845.1 NTE family protein [Vogesella sp. LIG4]
MIRLIRQTLALLLALLLASPALHAANPPRVGVVLGGGGARGFAHLGVLQELEKLHIPISCIAGTSAGALIGGAYASGQHLDTLEQQFAAADWDTLLAGKPRREDMPYQRKHNDAKNYFDLTFGYREGQVRLPPAAINAQAIDLFIRQLTGARNAASFDELSIPFRAVATDLENGDAVVFDKGDLSLAMRASMAVPGMFAAVESDGRLLVDGGLARQLPVEELKGRCADVLIVVDVGTPAVPREQLNNFLNVLDQTTYLMVARNSKESLARLGPDDILIRPQLDGFTPADFASNGRIIEAGRQAARAQAARLGLLAASDADYRQWQADRNMPPAPRIDQVQVNGDFHFINPQVIDDKLTISSHLGLSSFHQRLQDVFAEGDLERLDYTLQQQDGQNIAQVDAHERSTGPNYFRSGLELRSSSRGNATFSLLGEYRRSWLNSAGGSLLAEAKVGEEPTYSAEWDQPLSANSPLFGSLSGSYGEKNYSLYVQHQSEAQYSRTTRSLFADAGWHFGELGEARAGWYRSSNNLQLTVGSRSDNLNDYTSQEQGVRLLLALDQLDNPRWPRSGYAARLEARAPQGREGGAQVPPPSGSLSLDAVTTDQRDISWRFSLRGGYSAPRDNTNVFELGGFRYLSGYQPGELLGRQMLFARSMMSWRVASLPSAIGTGLYVGASAEVGRMRSLISNNQDSGWLPGGTLFMGADTLLGPLFMGIGQTKHGQLTGYLNLGVEY